MGRFLSTDPAGIEITNPQSWNRYAYVQNNPFRYIDPDGRVLLESVFIWLFSPTEVADAELEPTIAPKTQLQQDVEFAKGIALGFGAGRILGFAGSKAIANITNRAGQKALKSSPISGRIPNAGGFIRTFVTEKDEVFFRVFSGSNSRGKFLTKVRPKNRQQAIEGLALPPSNQATFIQQVIVPKGTKLKRSRALPAFEKRGGREQFELLDNIPNESFGPGVPFN